MSRSVVGVVAWLAGAVVAGAAEPPRCPAAADGEAHLRAPAGWTAAPVEAVHPFERIEIFAGHMGEQTKGPRPRSLRPTSDDPGAG